MAKNHDWIPLQNAARGSREMLDGMPEGFAEAMKNLPNARIGDFYTGNMQQIFNEGFGPNFDPHDRVLDLDRRRSAGSSWSISRIRNRGQARCG